MSGLSLSRQEAKRMLYMSSDESTRRTKKTNKITKNTKPNKITTDLKTQQQKGE